MIKSYPIHREQAEKLNSLLHLVRTCRSALADAESRFALATELVLYGRSEGGNVFDLDMDACALLVREDP